MTFTIGSHTMQTVRLDRTLQYAVIQSWDELMRNSPSESIQIEYQTGPDGTLDFLKIWESTIRGHWNLVCEFWMRPLWSHVTGLCFCGEYKAPEFAHTLELVMGNEGAFVKLPDRQGLIQIFAPTKEERKEAERWTEVAFNHEGPIPMPQQNAA